MTRGKKITIYEILFCINITNGLFLHSSEWDCFFHQFSRDLHAQLILALRGVIKIKQYKYRRSDTRVFAKIKNKTFLVKL